MSGFCSTAVRVLFLGYFVFNGYIALIEGPSHVNDLKKNYRQFESKFAKLSSTKLPTFMNAAAFDKHSFQIVTGLVMLQMLLAFLGMLTRHAAALTGWLYFLRMLFAHNAIVLLSQPHPLRDYEPFLRSLALLCASSALAAPCQTSTPLSPPKVAVDPAKKKK